MTGSGTGGPVVSEVTAWFSSQLAKDLQVPWVDAWYTGDVSLDLVLSLPPEHQPGKPGAWVYEVVDVYGGLEYEIGEPLASILAEHFGDRIVGEALRTDWEDDDS